MSVPSNMASTLTSRIMPPVGATPRTDEERLQRIHDLQVVIERTKGDIEVLKRRMETEAGRRAAAAASAGALQIPNDAPVDWNVPMIKRSAYLTAACRYGLYNEDEIERYFEMSKDKGRIFFPTYPNKSDERTAKEYALEYPLLTIACITLVALSQSKRLAPERMKYLERLIGETVFLEAALTTELQAVVVVVTMFLLPDIERKGPVHTLMTLAAGFVVDYANSEDVALMLDPNAPAEAVLEAEARVEDAVALSAVVASQSATFWGWDVFQGTRNPEPPVMLASFACGTSGGVLPSMRWCLEVNHVRNGKLLTIRQALLFLDNMKKLGEFDTSAFSSRALTGTTTSRTITGRPTTSITTASGDDNANHARITSPHQCLEEIMRLYEGIVDNMASFQREKCAHYRPYDFTSDVAFTGDAFYPLILMTSHETVMTKLMVLDNVDQQELCSAQLIVAHGILQTAEGLLRAFHDITDHSATFPVSWFFGALTGIAAMIRLRIVLWSLDAEVNFDVDREFSRLQERWELLGETSYLAFRALPDLLRVERWLLIHRQLETESAIANSLVDGSMSERSPGQWDDPQATAPPTTAHDAEMCHAMAEAGALDCDPGSHGGAMDWEPAPAGDSMVANSPDDVLYIDGGATLRDQLRNVFLTDETNTECEALLREVFSLTVGPRPWDPQVRVDALGAMR